MLFELGGKRKRADPGDLRLPCRRSCSSPWSASGSAAPRAAAGSSTRSGSAAATPPPIPQYDQQIDNAQQALQADPKDEKALLKLARYNFLEGQTSAGSRRTGPDHVERRDPDQLPGRDRRLGALPGDAPEEARRQRRRADAQGLLGLGGYRSRDASSATSTRRSRRRRSSPTPAPASAPTSSSPPGPTWPETTRPAPRRSRRRSRRLPIQPPRSRSRPRSRRPSSSGRWSSRR